MKIEDRVAMVLFFGEMLGLGFYLTFSQPFFFYSEPDWEAEAVIEDERTVEQIIRENSTMLENEILKENKSEAEAQEHAEQTGETDAGGTQAEENREPAEDVDAAVEKDQFADLDYQALFEHYFVVDPDTTMSAAQLGAEELLQRDLRMQGDNTKPQILIYHTHSQEGFADSVDGRPETTIVGVGDYLTQILQERYGYNVLHVTDTFDLIDGELDRNQAYSNARPAIEKMLEKNPSVEIVIDVHRDGVSEDRHLVQDINGKKTAQIMFFNGLSYTKENGVLDYLPNPYMTDNLAFSLQLKMQAEEAYPGWNRCIYLKGYRYNLHFRPRCLLLEVGAQTNTLEEEKNAMEPFADILNKVLQGE
ncbi:MAG: stage II sporulation protein P [Lachnospiraceae bacterium]|nr:stage II sporulation protein P [Lachnospiraceae bacterium]